MFFFFLAVLKLSYSWTQSEPPPRTWEPGSTSAVTCRLKGFRLPPTAWGSAVLGRYTRDPEALRTTHC